MEQNNNNRFCVKCGNRIMPGMRFCGGCGAPVAAQEAGYGYMQKPGNDMRSRDIAYLREEIRKGTRMRNEALIRGIVGLAAGIILFIWLGEEYDAMKILGIVGIISGIISLIQAFCHISDMDKNTRRLEKLERNGGWQR